MQTTPTDHGPSPRSRSSRAATTSVGTVRRRSSSTSRQMRTRAAPRRAWSPCARRSAGANRARSEVSGRRVQPVGRSRRGPDDPPLDRVRAASLDQLPAESAQQRMRHRPEPGGPQPRDPAHHVAKQRVTRERPQERRVVVVERQHEPKPLDPVVVRRPQHDRSVAELPGSAEPTARQRSRHRAVSYTPGRVSPCRQRERVGPAWLDHRLHHERGTIRLSPARVRTCRRRSIPARTSGTST